MAGPARTAVCIVAMCGALMGHALGYLLAHPHAHDRTRALAGHGYMEVAASLALPAMAAAVAWILLSRRAVREPVRPTTVAALQVALFVAQELFEHRLGAHGFDVAFSQPALWWGVAAQVAVGLVLGAVLRQAQGAVRRLRLGTSTVAPIRSREPAPRCPARTVPPPPRPSPLSRRGPPLPRVA